MPRTVVTFDGHRLTDYFMVTNLVLPPAKRTATTATVDGMDGAILTGVKLQPTTITMQLNAISGTKAERIALLDTLNGWLDVDEPRPLSFSFDNGKYYMAVPTNIQGRKRWSTADAYQAVAFYCPDPVRYGDDVTETISASGTIEVGGTYPTAVKVTVASAVRDGTTGYWGVTLDGQAALKVATGTAAGVVLEIDSGSRTAKVGNALKLPTLDSDWFDRVAPGEHTLARTLGTGAFVASWTERWV